MTVLLLLHLPRLPISHTDGNMASFDDSLTQLKHQASLTSVNQQRRAILNYKLSILPGL